MDLKLLERMLPHLDDWTVSVNGVRKGPVPSGTAGLKTETLWVDAVFMVDGAAHRLYGERHVVGGPALITLDGLPQAGAHLALQPHVRLFPLEVKVEIDFDLVGVVYRFDARVVR